MADHDITPERELHQPGPEEHPGEDGAYVDAERTRLKRRDPEGERLHQEHVPDETDADEREGDA